MITLDGYSLPKDLVWVDELKYQPVAMASKFTLGGTMVLFSQALKNGRPITLEARVDTGWLSREDVNFLLEKASIPNAVYSLTIGTYSFNVMFRHTEPPAFEAEPLIEGFESSDQHKGILKFFTV